MKILKKLLCYILLGVTAALFVSCAPNEEPDGVPGDDFQLKATITSIGDKIEVEVYDSEYAFGTYLVITGPATEYYDEAGKAITRTDLNVGDKVEIYYGGQVMMSLPPQIVAAKITRI